MRCALLLLLAPACGARLDGGPIAQELDDAGVEPDAALVIDAPPEPRPCTGGTAAMTTADGACLILFAGPASFDAAAQQCTANDTTLAILNNADRDTVAATLVGTQNVFIGLSDSVTEGTFVWADGTPLVFDNFDDGEPNNANGNFQEDCVIYAGSRDGWDDRPCSNDVPGRGNTPGEYPFLCMF